MSNIICKLFGHIWTASYEWHDKLKLNISTPTCVRCGKRNYKSYRNLRNDFEKTACPKCGAWVCTSGICVYCGVMDTYKGDVR
jgi:hypothetical protein